MGLSGRNEGRVLDKTSLEFSLQNFFPLYLFLASWNAKKNQTFLLLTPSLKSNVQRKHTKSLFAQSMFQAKKSNLLFLFNLKTDPNETSNLVRKYPKVFKMMMTRVRRIMRSGQVLPPDIPNLKSRSRPSFWNGTVSPGWCWGETNRGRVYILNLIDIY